MIEHVKKHNKKNKQQKTTKNHV